MNWCSLDWLLAAELAVLLFFHHAGIRISLDCESSSVTLALLQFHMERCSGELIIERLEGLCLEGIWFPSLLQEVALNLTAAQFINGELMSHSIINLSMLPQKEWELEYSSSKVNEKEFDLILKQRHMYFELKPTV